MSNRMRFFHEQSGSQNNSLIVSNIYSFVIKNNLRLKKQEPYPLEEIWQSNLVMTICDYVKNSKLKF
jgi:hypothetical protein